MRATPAKLRDGSWGARVTGKVKAGDAITITTRGGKSWDATVSAVVWTGSGISLCTTAKSQGYARGSYGDNAPGGRRCPECFSRKCCKAWDSNALCDED